MRGLLVAAVLSCALAGCGGDDGETATTPPGTTAATSAASALPAEPAGDVQEFVAVVRDRLPDVAAGRTHAELAAVATAACEGLAVGASADDVVANAQSLGTLDAEATDQATARELVKLAIDTVCPEESARVDEF